VNPDNRSRLERRIAEAAEAVLASEKFVSPIDVLVNIGWLPQSAVDGWRRGRLPYLEQGAQVNLSKLTTAMGLFRSWALDRGLKPSEAAYVGSGRDRRQLRFSASGDEAIERFYRTHWISPELSENKRQRLLERQSRAADLVAIWPLKDWTCSLCGGTGDLLLMEESGPVCLACADMDHLVFLAAGDATLSRRAKAASHLSAVVVRFSRARKRYERQGILVEEAALERAETECLADEEARARRRLRAAAQREREDVAFQAQLAVEIRRLFPGCPSDRADAIARHASIRGSGRIGRTAAARALDAGAVTLAVVASVRHQDTPYDELLMDGALRAEARERVQDDVDRVLDSWRRGRADAGFKAPPARG
jgi:hypothetical protein